MPRTTAISLLTGENAPASLAELYGHVIENVRKKALSQSLKNKNYSGDPAAGSVEHKRFANATPKEYGTARAAAKGDKIKAAPITVNLDDHREIVEEAAKNDIDRYGVTRLMQRRADNHVESMAAELDRDYFKCISDTAIEITPTETAINEIIEQCVQTLENVKNEYVDGVDRSLIDVVLNTTQYGKMRTFLDTQANPNVDTAGEEFGMYHGVKIYNSTRLAEGVNGLFMIRGAAAQPCAVDQYSEPEKIPLSNDYAVSLFYDKGEKNLTPDLTFVWKS